MADIQRSRAAEAAMKSIQTLGKSVGQPVAPRGQSYTSPAGAVPVSGGGLVMALLYIGAGVFAVLLILMAIDQWVTPVFQKAPGSSGFILVPGTDTTQVYWTSIKTVQDILIGTPPPEPTPNTGASVPLYTTVIEDQSIYSITLDVIIQNEFPQDIGDHPMRTFFILGESLSKPTISMGLDNSKNTVYITSVDTDGHIQTIVLDNVPIHKPFRIGFTKSDRIMEGYLNGKLVKTVGLRTQSIKPTSGSKIYAPSSMMFGTLPNIKSLSKGLAVMNLRLFPYTVSPEEMFARMVDLTPTGKYNPEFRASSLISTFSSYTGIDKLY